MPEIILICLPCLQSHQLPLTLIVAATVQKFVSGMRQRPVVPGQLRRAITCAMAEVAFGPG